MVQETKTKTKNSGIKLLYIYIVLSLFLSLFLVAICVFLQSTKEIGERGPEGIPGEQGAMGQDGPVGETGPTRAGILLNDLTLTSQIPQPNFCDNFQGIRIDIVLQDSITLPQCMNLPNRYAVLYTFCAPIVDTVFLARSLPVQQAIYRNCSPIRTAVVQEIGGEKVMSWGNWSFD